MNRASIRPLGLVARVGEVGCVVCRLEAPMKDPWRDLSATLKFIDYNVAMTFILIIILLLSHASL